MTSPALPLVVSALVRRYGAFTAVDRLDLEVRPGEILGFLGPNGAGKTTTLRVCSGLLRPDAGTVSIAGWPLAASPLEARARVGFLYDRLSGREFLDFVAAIYDVPDPPARERIGSLLERLGLAAVADDAIEGYSSGMRQKLSAAAALVHDPPLLMLDEPLQGLDPQGARTLKDLLRERTGRGFGVLVSTHLLDVAERLCDRVVILQRGRKLAEGTLDELRGPGSHATLEELFLELTRDAAT
jgi:ABC-2 type transport system ATP-binding protein